MKAQKILRGEFPPVLAELFRPVARFTVPVKIASNVTVHGPMTEALARAGEYSKMFAFNIKTNELRDLVRDEEYHYEIGVDEIAFVSKNYAITVFVPEETFNRLFKKESL